MRALLVVVALTSAAAAEPSVELTIAGNQVAAKVRGADSASPVVLRDFFDEKHREVTATSVRGFKDRPVAVAFVLHGTEFLGHSEHQHDEWADYPDPLTPLRDAFDKVGQSGELPKGSVAMLVNYASTAEIAQPWRMTTSLDGRMLGIASHYQGRAGNSLVAAVELAIRELEAKKDFSKLVIIIGDGNDANNDVGRATLSRLAHEHADIAFGSMLLKTPLSAESEIVSELSPVVTEVEDGLSVEDPLLSAIGQATARFDATFDLAAFPHDGQMHRFALVVGGDHIASATLTMPPAPPVPPPSKVWRYLVVLGVLAAFGLVSFVMFRPKGR